VFTNLNGDPMAPDRLSRTFRKLTADTYTSVLPEVAHSAAEKVASLISRAGCLVPARTGPVAGNAAGPNAEAANAPTGPRRRVSGRGRIPVVRSAAPTADDANAGSDDHYRAQRLIKADCR
jgi:hypothetical protein